MAKSIVLRVSMEFAEMMKQLKRNEQIMQRKQLSMVEFSQKMAMNRFLPLPSEAIYGKKRR